MCLGMGVIVAVQTGEDEISKLRDSRYRPTKSNAIQVYIKSYRNVAEQIKEAEFDAMGAAGANVARGITFLNEESVPMTSEPYAIPPKDRAC